MLQLTIVIELLAEIQEVQRHIDLALRPIEIRVTELQEVLEFSLIITIALEIILRIVEAIVVHQILTKEGTHRILIEVQEVLLLEPTHQALVQEVLAAETTEVLEVALEAHHQQ